MTRSRWLAFFCGVFPTTLALVIYIVSGSSSPLEVSAPRSPASPQRSISNGSSLLRQWNAHSGASLEESIAFIELLDVQHVEALLVAAKSFEDSDPVRFQRLFDRFAELDTSAALDFAVSTWHLEERLSRIATLVYRWAGEDPDSCWEWISTNYQASEASLWNPFLHKVYAQRSLGEPSSNEIARTWNALERFAETSNGYLSELPFNGVIEDTSTRQPSGSLWFLINESEHTGNWQETMERLAEFTGEQLGQGWANLVFTHWKASDLDAAMSWNHRRMDLGLSSCGGNSGYARVKADLGADLGWLIEHDRVDRIHQVKDVPRITEWLTTVAPEDPRYDDIRVDLVDTLDGVDTHAAISWAQTIVNSSIRDGMVNRAVRHWAELEPVAAEDYTREELGWSAEDFAKAIKPERRRVAE